MSEVVGVDMLAGEGRRGSKVAECPGMGGLLGAG